MNSGLIQRLVSTQHAENRWQTRVTLNIYAMHPSKVQRVLWTRGRRSLRIRSLRHAIISISHSYQKLTRAAIAQTPSYICTKMDSTTARSGVDGGGAQRAWSVTTALFSSDKFKKRGNFAFGWLCFEWLVDPSSSNVGVYSQMFTLLKAKESQKIKPRILHLEKRLLVMVDRTDSDEKEEREGKKETLIAIYCLHA